MTVLDIDRVIPAPPVTNTELNADDARRRNQHGFWVAPGSRMTAAKVETVSEDEQ